ncbi:Hypothetical protein D9617_20g026920 [Elsinoe fawcettii]|nr:Hypothetical protein D9617_20g026920 [Elsinoe fawcettii]
MSLPPLTERETQLMFGGLLCQKHGDIQVDYDKLATLLNFKNGQSAKASWNSLMRKVRGYKFPGKDDDDTTDANADATATAKRPVNKKGTAKKVTKRKTATPSDDEDAAEGAEGEEKPAKKTRTAAKKTTEGKGKKGKAAVKKEDEAETDDEDGAVKRGFTPISGEED